MFVGLHRSVVLELLCVATARTGIYPMITLCAIHASGCRKMVVTLRNEQLASTFSAKNTDRPWRCYKKYTKDPTANPCDILLTLPPDSFSFHWSTVWNRTCRLDPSRVIHFRVFFRWASVQHSSRKSLRQLFFHGVVKLTWNGTYDGKLSAYFVFRYLLWSVGSC